MASVLTDYVFRRKKRNGSLLWDKFMDGQVWSLTCADVAVKNINSLAAAISYHTKKRNLKYRINYQGNDGVIFQAILGSQESQP